MLFIFVKNILCESAWVVLHFAPLLRGASSWSREALLVFRVNRNFLVSDQVLFNLGAQLLQDY